MSRSCILNDSVTEHGLLSFLLIPGKVYLIKFHGAGFCHSRLKGAMHKSGNISEKHTHESRNAEKVCP